MGRRRWRLPLAPLPAPPPPLALPLALLLTATVTSPTLLQSGQSRASLRPGEAAGALGRRRREEVREGLQRRERAAVGVDARRLGAHPRLRVPPLDRAQVVHPEDGVGVVVRRITASSVPTPCAEYHRSTARGTSCRRRSARAAAGRRGARSGWDPDVAAPVRVAPAVAQRRRARSAARPAVAERARTIGIADEQPVPVKMTPWAGRAQILATSTHERAATAASASETAARTCCRCASAATGGLDGIARGSWSRAARLSSHVGCSGALRRLCRE